MYTDLFEIGRILVDTDLTLKCLEVCMKNCAEINESEDKWSVHPN